MVEDNIDKVILALRLIKMLCHSFYYVLPRNRRDTIPLETYEENEPIVTMFSDSVVISQEIDDYFDIETFTHFISIMQFELLLIGVLIRGGISLGQLYHDSGFLFGRGMVNAYTLESESAIFPRIIISNELMAEYTERRAKYQKEIFSVHVNEEFQFYEKTRPSFDCDDTYADDDDYADLRSKMVKVDDDGLLYVDYFTENLNFIFYSRNVPGEFDDIHFRLFNDCYDDRVVPIKNFMGRGSQTLTKFRMRVHASKTASMSSSKPMMALW